MFELRRYLPRLVMIWILMGLVISSCGLVEVKSPRDESSSIPSETLPLPTETPIFRVAYDVVFAALSETDGKEQKLDVYAPDERKGLPVVIFLHGFRGNKRGLVPESQAIAEKGMVVFTINWPTWTVPTSSDEDGKLFRQSYEILSCAVKFARSKAADYGGDPLQMILIGHSWGAAFGSWIALGGDVVATEWESFSSNRGGPPPQTTCVVDDVSAKVDTFIGIGGGYEHVESVKEVDEELWQVVSPIAHLGQNPTLRIRLLHGESDTVVIPAESVYFNDLLVENGYDSQLIMFDGIHQIPLSLLVELVQELTTD